MSGSPKNILAEAKGQCKHGKRLRNIIVEYTTYIYWSKCGQLANVPNDNKWVLVMIMVREYYIYIEWAIEQGKRKTACNKEKKEKEMEKKKDNPHKLNKTMPMASLCSCWWP